jgi:hypothetical protein
MERMAYYGNKMAMSNCNKHLSYTFVIRWREDL